MTTKRWLLRELTAGVDTWSVDLDGLAGDFDGCSVHLERLRGGRSDGVEVVRVRTPRVELEVVPTRGMGIRKANVDGVHLGWASPVRGPVHPMWVDLSEPSGLGWLAGFDEFLVRCGLSSNGAPEFDPVGRLRYPLHGRIANVPAHDVALEFVPERGELVLTGVVEEARFASSVLRLTSRLVVRPGEAAFVVRDTVVNRSATPAVLQLLYHVNLGPPLLSDGSSLVAPVAEVVPRDQLAAAAMESWRECEPPGSSAFEQVYFCRLYADAEGRTGVLFRDSTGSAGLTLHFELAQLPCFTYWKNMAHEADGYVIGLEPATNFPNPRSFEATHGRVITLEPGGERTFELALSVHNGPEAVTAAEQWIDAMSGSTSPMVHDAPSPDFCAESRRR